jgi:hypothetical protein
MSDSALLMCSAGSGGCNTSTMTTCGAGSVCERIAPADCVDPSWAEWPMPNGPADVKAGASNAGSYTNNGDGTVTDNITGLMWQQTISPTATALSQTQAIAFCPTLSLAGHSDWRLPTVIELVSLVDYGVTTGALINATAFPQAPASVFWSSTPLAGSPSSGFFVLFYNGVVSTYPAAYPNQVRCVR